MAQPIHRRLPKGPLEVSGYCATNSPAVHDSRQGFYFVDGAPYPTTGPMHEIKFSHYSAPGGVNLAGERRTGWPDDGTGNGYLGMVCLVWLFVWMVESSDRGVRPRPERRPKY